MTTADEAHFGACHRLTVGSSDLAGEAILHIVPQPVVHDVTEGQKPAQVPFGKPVLGGPSGQVASIGLPCRRLQAAHYRNRRLGGASQDGVARVVVVSRVSAGK